LANCQRHTNGRRRRENFGSAFSHQQAENALLLLLLLFQFKLFASLRSS
jgi:hypothetical protein